MPIGFLWVLIIAMVWTLFWKGLGIWVAARRGNTRWFIALMIFNTFGLLDMFYLFYIAKKTPQDLGRMLKKKI